MIVEETVLILGAGASVDYGYPTGIGLAQTILAALANENSEFYVALTKMGFPRNHINDFRLAFSQSPKNSIDAFLENRKPFRDIGKAAIARVLIPLEKVDKLSTNRKGWYNYLFNVLASGTAAKDLWRHKITFVTFNYDRSFEQYLFNGIKHTFGENDESVFEIMKKFHIIHVHGILGHMPWHGSADTGRSYGHGIDNDQVILQASRGIRIVHDDHDNDAFHDARNWLSAAKRIIFLGFGYDHKNIERLQIPWGTDVKIYGSYLDIYPRERSQIITRYHHTIEFGETPIREFLRRDIIL